MSRRGFVMPALLLAAGAAGLLTFTIVAGAAQRSRLATQHQARVQGREWCLGARVLPPGSACTVGSWRIVVDRRRDVSASDVRGTYRITAEGTESWSRTP